MTTEQRQALLDASTLISKLAATGQPYGMYRPEATQEQRDFVAVEIQDGQTALELLFSAQDHIEDRLFGIVGRNGIPTPEAAALDARLEESSDEDAELEYREQMEDANRVYGFTGNR